jgi:energy-coupling factor transporter ATP-binding protein EcfA2
LFAARGGGTLAYALAGFSAVGTAIESLYPKDSGWEVLRAMGLTDADLTVGGYFCDLMVKDWPYEVVALSQFGTMTLVWRDTQDQPIGGAIYAGGKFSDGPFLMKGEEERFYEAVRQVVWAKGRELQLGTTKTADFSWRAAGRFHLDTMVSPGPFIGKQRPEWFADRLRRYGGNQSLTVRFRGPTGSGKTVLARHLSRLLRPTDSRTLKVSSEVLQKCRSDEVRGLVACLQPTVLILDDLKLSEHSELFLELLESLRSPDTLTVVTEMTRFADSEAPKPGGWHIPGGRPCRIDETFYFGPPDEEERGWILDHYAGELNFKLKTKLRAKLIKATEGLTGAFIGNIVLRLATHGTENWRHEVDQVLYVAPFESKDEKEKEGGPDAPAKTPGKNKAVKS